MVVGYTLMGRCSKCGSRGGDDCRDFDEGDDDGMNCNGTGADFDDGMEMDGTTTTTAMTNPITATIDLSTSILDPYDPTPKAPTIYLEDILGDILDDRWASPYYRGPYGGNIGARWDSVEEMEATTTEGNVPDEMESTTTTNSNNQPYLITHYNIVYRSHSSQPQFDPITTPLPNLIPPPIHAVMNEPYLTWLDPVEMLLQAYQSTTEEVNGIINQYLINITTTTPQSLNIEQQQSMGQSSLSPSSPSSFPLPDHIQSAINSPNSLILQPFIPITTDGRTALINITTMVKSTEQSATATSPTSTSTPEPATLLHHHPIAHALWARYGFKPIPSPTTNSTSSTTTATNPDPFAWAAAYEIESMITIPTIFGELSPSVFDTWDKIVTLTATYNTLLEQYRNEVGNGLAGGRNDAMMITTDNSIQQKQSSSLPKPQSLHPSHHPTITQLEIQLLSLQFQHQTLWTTLTITTNALLTLQLALINLPRFREVGERGPDYGAKLMQAAEARHRQLIRDHMRKQHKAIYDSEQQQQNPTFLRLARSLPRL